MSRQLAVVLSALWLSACSPPQQPAPNESKPNAYTASYSSEGDFEFVTQDIKIAIQNRGLVIDHTSHIAEMLDRTGKDLGTPTQLYLKGEA